MRYFHPVLSLSAAFLAASTLFSLADAPAFSRDPAAVQAGAYKVEPSHTRILFAVSHMGFTTWYGNFTGAGGELKLHPPRRPKARLKSASPSPASRRPTPSSTAS